MFVYDECDDNRFCDAACGLGRRLMIEIFVCLLAGLIFGFGLVVSGMANPSKVLNFLDLFGAFDPSLIFVMAGAVLVSFVGYRLVWKMKSPLFSGEFNNVPIVEPHMAGQAGMIDGRLVVGAVLFGVGWGVVGFCPGPALASLTFGGLSALLFVVAMMIGVMAARLINR